MGVLQRFERRLEGLVSGAFGRVFKGQVEPVEVAAELQRETDDRRAVVGGGRVLVPNDFVVELGTRDYERLSPYAEQLGAEFASMVDEHAVDRGYSFVGPVQVALEHAPALETGFFRVRSGVAAPGGGRTSAGWEPAPPDPRAPAPADFRAPARAAAPAAPPAPVSTPTAGTALDDEPTRTSPLAAPALPRLTVEGGSEEFPLERPVSVIGRSSDADVRLADTGVSRRHAELHRTGTAVTVVDLGSTNGTAVNGRAVTRRELADGDRMVVGTTTLVFRAADAD